jgi:hypothetical protein
MVRQSKEIRSATSGEMFHAIGAIVAAFITDPIARFAWPSPHDHLRGMPLAAQEFAGASFEHRTAYVSADFCGAALWLPPGAHANGEALERFFATPQNPSIWTTCLRPSRRWDSGIPTNLTGICR